MRRTPLRPLARILEARQLGQDPNAIEAENVRRRSEAARDRLRRVSERRVQIAAVLTLAAFCLVGVRMWAVASEPAAEPIAHASASGLVASRAEIVDRNGRVLAMNMQTQSLYAHPHEMTDPERAARSLARIFPELDEARLIRDFTGSRRFVWVRPRLSPEQRQAVFDLGEPGLYFGNREMRLYPNGPVAAHVLGGARFETEDVRWAELKGVAGVEARFDDWLRDPANDGAPLALSIDLTAQVAMEEVLAGGMALMNAKGAAAVLMHSRTGEIRAIASLPDFDPNDRPPPPVAGQSQDDSPIFNRAVQGTYELGSTFKLFPIAQALQQGLVTSETIIDTRGPMTGRGYSISDFRNYGPTQTVRGVLVKSSNVGTARLAQQIGIPAQREFLERLGLLVASPVELPEARRAVPQVGRWEAVESLTISYGHGISTSLLNLAAAYSSLLNGGQIVTPTLLPRPSAPEGDQIVSATVSAELRDMLRAVIEEGTASLARVDGYSYGGKTGSADKPNPQGGYFEDRVIASFASVLPADQPEYVLVVMLDEPQIEAYGELRRTAGWTAAPVAGEMARRLAPILGLRPSIAKLSPAALDRP